jgi:hypothetical protein
LLLACPCVLLPAGHGDKLNQCMTLQQTWCATPSCVCLVVHSRVRAHPNICPPIHVLTPPPKYIDSPLVLLQHCATGLPINPPNATTVSHTHLYLLVWVHIVPHHHLTHVTQLWGALDAATTHVQQQTTSASAAKHAGAVPHTAAMPQAAKNNMGSSNDMAIMQANTQSTLKKHSPLHPL